ncbi:NAD(P)-dependent dehydrogenase, short-chain alcohol dehydrogenase family [Variovorax sp. OK605]|jgi:3-oxoacyl-[acyl-carrier protein] reductase|uniref:SDR family NAD(P)-dependent oxidoreductase n=1 Tax=unclassified Variovorax TaxID=663243 RepID=UPI0008D366C4|nr:MULTISPECIES: glucose 1-dehydrogenase [unclassified Variovorax]SEK16439.1 NAD(P)-dependent dehydrogenase, short-chain alcohol dehydrogenase family [Variovorax sp. OK202]SFE47974.1 NAD(P)-dependent dehydrogenase, short-chain alcohol dehydrogenase family [Variovorax sp. OK212]SFQ68914.1 NAD(P)-dependent dehydrogenase, short-chain alcohol dehydrogenase family [Variovorax sp. OK605]
MDGKVALITGAAVGIGAAIAQSLAHDGHAVVVADIDAAAADETARRLSAEGFDAWPLAMDVGNADAVAAGFAAVREKYGRCDVLVNNAGIAKTYAFLDYPMDHWDKVMAVNVTGPLICAQHAARLMRARGWGRIVNMTSVSGMRASAGRTAYGTSKAALIGLTRQMAIELAPFGITANGVSPGPIDTPLTLAHHSQATRANYARSIPSARYGTTYEVAGAVSYLVSDRAAFVTGHILPVDGGFMAAGLLEI